MRSQTISRTVLMMIALCLVILVLGGVMVISPRSTLADTSIIYVDVDASAGGDGQTWGTAYRYLQDALDEANANGANDYEIWVAEGVYYPDEDGDGDHISGAMTETFSLNYNNVQLYGGFVGTETVRSQCDWHANVTVLSGDIDGNDMTNADGVVTDADNIEGNNTHHVLYLNGVINEPITSTTTIDGFTITAGQANGGSEWDDGGGLYCDGHDGHVCSPALTNLVFYGNLAEDYGGAIFDYAYTSGESNPTLTNVTFSGNWADEGGAMYNDGHWAAESSPMLTNVIFRDNLAGHGWTSDHGGAMFNNGDQGTSNPMLINVLFSHNSADGDGGALYCTGMHGRCNPTLINVTFSDNSAGDDGGAIAHGGYPDPDNANLTLSNVILWGNTAADGGDQMMVAYAILTIGHSDVQGGLLGSGVYYVESTLVDLGGNIDINPRFVGTGVGNLRLFDTSPCIDAGDSDAVPSGITTDLDGNPRFVDFPPPGGTGSGTPPFVDMGAYEEPLEGYHEYRVHLPLVLKE